MEDRIIENIRYKIELKKLISDKQNVHNSETHVDPWSDDLDADKLQEDNVDNNASYSILYGGYTDEAKLIEENIDLYSDLIKIEEEEKKAKQIQKAEFENCKKEIEKLKETDTKKRTRIEELTRENENLKQSLSSLYRTVKREIEFKDKSLEEANSKISRLESMKIYGNMFLDNDMCPNCAYNSSTFTKDSCTSKRKRSESPESSSKKRECKSGRSRSYETESEKDRRKTERKSEHEIAKNRNGLDESGKDGRKTDKKSEYEITKNRHGLDESEKDRRKRDKKSEHEVTKNRHGLDESDRRKTVKKTEFEISKNKHDLDLPTNKDEENVSHKQASKTANHDKETQTSNQCIFCKTHKSSNAEKSSRDPSEINDMFFNLLPDSLKQSFYDYEQDQMISLSKLKESFIDKYLNSDIPSPILESTPKTKNNRTDKEQLTSNKNLKTRSSSTVSTPKSSSEHKKNIESSRRGRRSELDENETRKDYVMAQSSSHTAKIPKNCYNSRLDKKDLVSLFMYRNEKIPFTEKKKFGLHKDDKNLIPEKIL